MKNPQFITHGTCKQSLPPQLDYLSRTRHDVHLALFLHAKSGKYYVKLIHSTFLLAALLSCNALASEDFSTNLQGHLGIFANAASSSIRGNTKNSALLPYAYLNYKRVFSRIDTFGIKTLPIAYGHLEIVARIKRDGYKTIDNTQLKGITDREDSTPIGISTFQLTPLGGLFLYAFYDANRSHGNIYEATYVAKFSLGGMTVYPQIGIEHLSLDYTGYYYGVSANESLASGYAGYTPTASNNRMLSALFEIPISDTNWFANIYLKRKWLGDAITSSPLVSTQFEDNGFIAITYRFD